VAIRVNGVGTDWHAGDLTAAFDGKTLIHPRQVDVCNRVFTPTPEQVDDARAVLAAWEEALAQGRAVATVGGRMVESLHVDAARSLIARHDAVTSPDEQPGMSEPRR